ncbi:MAG: CAP domain-containing protein [Oscillospiraceae bacterium]|jgi:uncharacterized protein YkwD|nr:CAP domain-containing protein [Oscillospiraceae bacterium]
MKTKHCQLLRLLAVLTALALLVGVASLPAAAAVPQNAAAEVVRLVNEERAKAGLSALANNYDALSRAAQIRAEELPYRIDQTHQRPDGRECFTVLEECGITSYRAAGENIAAGQKTPQEVVNDWMSSPGHRANILGNFNSIGVGVTESNGRLYWSQEFLQRRISLDGLATIGGFLISLFSLPFRWLANLFQWFAARGK